MKQTLKDLKFYIKKYPWLFVILIFSGIFEISYKLNEYLINDNYLLEAPAIFKLINVSILLIISLFFYILFILILLMILKWLDKSVKEKKLKNKIASKDYPLSYFVAGLVLGIILMILSFIFIERKYFFFIFGIYTIILDIITYLLFRKKVPGP